VQKLFPYPEATVCFLRRSDTLGLKEFFFPPIRKAYSSLEILPFLSHRRSFAFSNLLVSMSGSSTDKMRNPPSDLLL